MKNIKNSSLQKLFYVCVTLIIAVVMVSHITQAQPKTPNKTNGNTVMSQEISTKEIAQIFGPAKGFDAKRTAQQLSQCAKWQEPVSTDTYANNWYRAATSIHAKGFLTGAEHQKMLVLYEGAARKGHYLAIKNLIIIYSDNQVTTVGTFVKEPLKARIWLTHGLRKGWAGALEWLSVALANGDAGYKRNERLSMAYLQQASDLGVALAQYQLSLHYRNALRQLDKREALLGCAASQGLHAALFDWGIIKTIDEEPEVALNSLHRAVMAGGEAGARAANYLGGGFHGFMNKGKELNITPDPKRVIAYDELSKALSKVSHGNNFLRFPRLNEVLPLPPATMPEWKGIYSAMSPEDAAYYQNPPSPDFYIEEIRKLGYMVTQEYLSKPIPEVLL